MDYNGLMDTLGKLVTFFKFQIDTIKTCLTNSGLIAVTFFSIVEHDLIINTHCLLRLVLDYPEHEEDNENFER